MNKIWYVILLLMMNFTFTIGQSINVKLSNRINKLKPSQNYIGKLTVNSLEDGYVNFRSDPTLNDKNILFDLPNSEEMFVVEKYNNNWYIVEYGNQRGYVTTKTNMVLFESFNQIKSKTQYKVVVSSPTGYVNARIIPFGKKIKKILNGKKLLYLGKKKGYYKVKFNKKIVYVSADPSLTRLLKIEINGKVDERYITSCTQKQKCLAEFKIDSLLQKGELDVYEVKEFRKYVQMLQTSKDKQIAFLALQTRTKYMNQLENTHSDAAKMCNLTSAAMCLEYLGIPKPCSNDDYKYYPDCLESIRVENDFNNRTEISGWSACLDYCGAKTQIIDEKVVKNKSWYFKHVLSEMQAGNAIMMSITGHIVRVVTINKAGIYVYDPYGFTLLKKGKNYMYKKRNDWGYDDKGQNVLWTWDKVSKHSMLWIASISKK